MMFTLLMALALLAGTLLQAQIPGIAIFGGIRWPVLCSASLYYALNHRGSAGVVCGFAAGLLMDALSPVPLGFSVLMFSAMAWASGRCRHLVLPEAVVTSAFFGGLSGMLYALLLSVLLLRGGLQGGHPMVAVARIAGSCVAGAVTAPVVFMALSRLHKALDLGDKEDAGRVNA